MEFNRLTKEEINIIKAAVRETTEKKEYVSSGFWDNNLLKTDVRDRGEIRSPEDIKKTLPKDPYPLPEQLEWCDLDPTSDKDMSDMSKLLNRYYMYKDGDDMSLEYPVKLLQWYLSMPNDKKNICLGIRLKKDNKLIATITGVYFEGSFFNNKKNMLDVDLFCIHPVLRTKGLAEIMINELVRQMNLNDVFHGTFSGARDIPKSVCKLKFYHRPLNLKKLVETKFYTIDGDFEVGESFDFKDKADEHFTEASIEDLSDIHNLLNSYLEQYSVHFIFSKDQVKHMFFNENVDCYIYKDNGKVTDFISYYKIRSKVIKPDKEENRYISMGHIFYYANTSMTMYRLGKNMLIKAKEKNIDVINCLDDMDNYKMIDNLNFTEGTGRLRHYLYNWITPEIDPSDTAKHVI